MLAHNVTGLITSLPSFIASLKNHLLSVYYTPTSFIMADGRQFLEEKTSRGTDLRVTEVAIVYGVAREGLSAEATFEQSPEQSKGAGRVAIWGKNTLGRGNSQCKGPAPFAGANPLALEDRSGGRLWEDGRELGASFCLRVTYPIVLFFFLF